MFFWLVFTCFLSGNFDFQFFDHTCCLWKFPNQGRNQSHSCAGSHHYGMPLCRAQNRTHASAATQWLQADSFCVCVRPQEESPPSQRPPPCPFCSQTSTALPPVELSSLPPGTYRA